MAPSETEQLDALVAMFPDIEADVLSAVLAFHNGDIEQTVASLLDASDGAMATDAEIAHATQLEIDEQAARALQQDLQAEVAAADAARAQQPAARAVAAVDASISKAAGGTRKLLQLIRSGRAPVRNRHKVRLLDDDGDQDGDFDSIAEAAQLSYTPPEILPPPPAAEEPDDRYASRVQRARAANQARGQRSTTTSPTASPPLTPIATPTVPVGELI